MACVGYFAHPFEVLASEYAGIDHPNLTCQIGAMKQANAPRPTHTHTHAPNHTHAHPAVRTRARIRQRAHLMCTHAHKTQVRAESAPDSVGALQLPLPLRSKFDTQPRSTYNETHQIQCTGLLGNPRASGHPQTDGPTVHSMPSRIRSHNPEVVGSNPTPATKKRPSGRFLVCCRIGTRNPLIVGSNPSAAIHAL